MKKVIIIALFFVFGVNINLVLAQEIVSVNPVQNALNISKNTNISVTFNEDMNASTINDSTFIVHSFQTGLQTGTYGYDTGTKTATFNPDNNFTVGEIVYVILTTGIENTTGDTLTGPYEWSFTIEVDGGSGEFAAKVDYGAGNTPWSVFSSDLDSDGDMDLTVANGASDNVSILLNNGDGTFAAKVDYGAGNIPYSVFSSDLDCDGDMDLTVANGASDNVSILLNNGNGTFAAKVDYGAGHYPISVFSSDLDCDGDMDLAVANYNSGNVSILLNNGNGTFAAKVDYGTGDGSISVFSSDLVCDGDMDLAAANYGSGNVSILLNNGNGTFAAKVDYGAGSFPYSVFSSDLDCDGDMDLAAANRFSNNVSVLLNNGDGTFAAKVDYGVVDGPMSVFSSDLDSDGDMDLTVANRGSDNVSVLLNNNLFITVTSPNGGEDWQVGSGHDITWTSTGTSGTVNIEYSTDNGSNWMELVDSTEDNGNYPWTIPGTPSDSCLVRITDTDGSPSDTSDAVFTISVVPFITVSSPNGGENWQVDSTYDITWISSGTTGNVRIEYSTNNGNSWIQEVTSTTDDGSYSWMIPDIPSDSCLVRVKNWSGSPSDISDTVFTISTASGVPVEGLPEVYSFNVKGIVTNNQLEVRYGVPEKAQVGFWVYDIKGTKVKEFSEENPAGFYSVRINMSGKPAGVYFLKMEANGKKFTQTSKFVKM